MDCAKIMDMVYEHDKDTMPLLSQIYVAVHAFFCSSCAQKIENFYAASVMLKEELYQKSVLDNNSFSALEDSIMSKIAQEELPEISYSQQGVSTRGWVIAGLILLVSLVTVFFGLDFKSLANASGMSFMLPIGITVGIILTIYGALFIGSHLKELSERFGL